jgi:hypothetical protein
VLLATIQGGPLLERILVFRQGEKHVPTRASAKINNTRGIFKKQVPPVALLNILLALCMSLMLVFLLIFMNSAILEH